MNLISKALLISSIGTTIAAVQFFSPQVPLTAETAKQTNKPQLLDQAVTYQINQSHTGFVQTSGLNLPLKQKWAINLGGAISYPLIAEGKVFVTVRNASSYGTKLYGINAATGEIAWGPIEISGTYYWSNAAYSNGRIFVVNFDGLLRALDAKTGTQKWSRQLPGQYAFSSPPTAAKGIVYVGGAGSGGTIYAVNAINGAVLWTSPFGGSNSSPTLSKDGVHVSYSCPNVYKLNRLTGALLWRYPNPPTCSGGGGKTSVYHQGSLYVRDNISPGYILDSQTGKLLGRFSAKSVPAFVNNLGVFLNSGTLEGKDLKRGIVLWSFAGAGSLSSAPLIVNKYAYVGSTSGNLYAVNLLNGKQVWSTNVGAAIPAPDEQNVSQPLTGLGAGEGLLVVPAGSRLVAYEGS